MAPLATPDHPVWEEIAPELVPRPPDFRYPHVMDAEFLRWLSRRRRRAGVPFRIVSDHRPPARNADVGGATSSTHMEVPCSAADLQVHSSHERFLVLREALAGDAPDTLREILRRIELPPDLRARAELALSDLCRRVGIYPPTEAQKRIGPNAGTVHLDRSRNAPQDVAWVTW